MSKRRILNYCRFSPAAHGQLLLPPDAPWLSEFKAEVLAFPNGRFTGQVDALGQLMIWVRAKYATPAVVNAGPEVFYGDGQGGVTG
ncbi:hypothetical protein [Sphingosinicella sp.]|uniref:hypothetical protein n=1 Tax=Sphingosinicella sp. TaxID=1917971 RepID=UPI0040377F0C